jgi:hypothetical protein
MPNTSETGIATAILRIALTRENGLVTLKRAYKEIPDYINLTAYDQSQSVTRPNEPMWHQIVRNIQSHWNMPGNFIDEGYLEHVPRVGSGAEGCRIFARRIVKVVSNFPD